MLTANILETFCIDSKQFVMFGILVLVNVMCEMMWVEYKHHF